MLTKLIMNYKNNRYDQKLMIVTQARFKTKTMTTDNKNSLV